MTPPPKVLPMDADGVILRNDRIFSHQYAAEQGIEAAEIEPFFQGEFRLATVGRTDLKDLIARHHALWHWDGSPEELLERWFAAESNVDHALLEVLQQLRQQGLKVYLATDQEKYRAQYLRERLLKDRLDGFFVSCDLGIEKKNPQFFREILKRLPGVTPHQVLFFDDSQHKVDSAHAAGLRAELYTSRGQVEALLATHA